MKGVEIKLEWAEVTLAAMGGVMRNLMARKYNRQVEKGRSGIGIEQDVVGALGEFALAKHTNLFWTPHVGYLDTHLGDVGRIQVKATTLQHGSLIVQEDDDPRFPFVLAIVAAPRVQLVGWMMGVEAKTERYWRPEGGKIHQAAFFVPQECVLPMDDLMTAGGVWAIA